MTLDKIRSYISSKTRLDKGTKHNPAEIVRGFMYLSSPTTMSPYLSMQSRVILFKKLDLWQAQYHTMDLIRIPLFRKDDLIVPTDIARDVFALLDNDKENRLEAFLAKHSIDQATFESDRKNILRQLKIGRKNQEELSAYVSAPYLSELLSEMVCQRDIAIMEPLGWQGDNFKYDIFENVFTLKVPTYEKALKSFVSRTFTTFAPMTYKEVADFAELDLETVTNILEKSFEPVELEVEGLDHPLFIAKSELNDLKQHRTVETRLIANLLPAGDTYFSVYSPEYYGDCFDPKSNMIVINGRVCGTWTMKDTTLRLHVDSDDEHIQEHALHEARFLPNLFGQEHTEWTFKME